MDFIKHETEMQGEGDIWLQKVQDQITEQREQEKAQENKLKQIQEEQKKRILETYLQENI